MQAFHADFEFGENHYQLKDIWMVQHMAAIISTSAPIQPQLRIFSVAKTTSMKAINIVFLLILMVGLTACGGGTSFSGTGGGTTGGGGTSGTLAISVVLVDAASGTTATGVSPTNPGELRATVTLNGIALADEVVTITTTLGVLSPASGTALTNISGAATIGLEEGGVEGAGTATASITYQGTTATDTVSFQVSTSGGGGPTVLSMGYGTVSGTSVTGFTADTVDIGLTTLSAGGTTSATVLIVDAAFNLYTTPVNVSFTSGCVGTGASTMDASVTTVNGVASSTYLAQGCVGSDTIIASASIGGTTHTATGSLTVQAGSVGSIEFVSATPANITLQGTGGAGRSETSVVVFRVIDVQGDPVQGQDVAFALNTTVGGITLDPSSATSDNNGLVQTTVQAGTIATSVRVTASATSGSNTYESQSDQLVITTGIPDDDSMDIVATVLNPEGWNISGTDVSISARLADRFNNPVPDGTAITFTTEGGSIDSFCTTTDGSCVVTWTSQDPRPCGETLGAAQVQVDTTAGPNVCVLTPAGSTNPIDPQTGSAPLGQPYGGRATILATAVGEESFTDVNGNGVFDEGDLYNDLPEAWLDSNEDNIRDANEPYLDFNSTGIYNSADGEFNGILCSRPFSNDCSTAQTLHIRDSLVLVMSGSTGFMVLSPSTITTPNDGSAGATLTVSDLHNQPMPAGTTISVAVSPGFTLITGNSFTMANTNTNSAVSIGVTIEGTGSTTGANGILTVTTTTPDGLVTIETFGITETAPPTADVGVILAGPAGNVAQGDDATYIISVTNTSGPDSAAAVATQFVVDSNFTAVSITPSTGSCAGIATITCSLGTLAIGDVPMVTIVLNAKTVPVLTSNLLTSHSVTVTSGSIDNNAGNDTAGVFTTVTP